MHVVGKFLLDFLWGKLLKEGVPWLLQWFKNQSKKIKITKEVNEEQSELDKLKKEVAIWAEKNPGKPLPKELEDRYRAIAGSRTDGL